MEKASVRALARLHPDAFAAEDASWQERKSAQTRIALLEATIDSLQTLGYARTTTQTIADMAKISRGAMIYHYSTKLDLITAAIDYAFYKRMELYVQEIAALTPEQREDVEHATELHWKSMQTREFGALLELAMASRTDLELRALLTPKARLYDRVWNEEMSRLFTEFKGEQKLIQAASDFSNAINEGLLVTSWLWDTPPQRQQEVRALAATVIRMVRDGELKIPKMRAKTPRKRKKT